MNDNSGDLPFLAETHVSSGEPERAQVWREPADRLQVMLRAKATGPNTFRNR